MRLKKRFKLFRDRIKTALAVQGAIFILIKILTYIQTLGVFKRYCLRLMWKGYLAQWFILLIIFKI